MPQQSGRDVTLDPPCMYCKNRMKVGQQYTSKGWTCKAFPHGIPNEIFTRQLAHTIILEGQEGEFVFESKEYSFEDGKYIITFGGEWIKLK